MTRTGSWWSQEAGVMGSRGHTHWPLAGQPQSLCQCCCLCKWWGLLWWINCRFSSFQCMAGAVVLSQHKTRLTRCYLPLFMEPDKWQEELFLRFQSLFVVSIFFQLFKVLAPLWVPCLSKTQRDLHFDLQRAELASLLDFAGSSENDMHHCVKGCFEWQFLACTPNLWYIGL